MGKLKTNAELLDKKYYDVKWARGYERMSNIGPFMFGTYDQGWGRYHCAIFVDGIAIYSKQGIIGESNAKKTVWNNAVKFYKKWKDTGVVEREM